MALQTCIAETISQPLYLTIFHASFKIRECKIQTKEAQFTFWSKRKFKWLAFLRQHCLFFYLFFFLFLCQHKGGSLCQQWLGFVPQVWASKDRLFLRNIPNLSFVLCTKKCVTWELMSEGRIHILPTWLDAWWSPTATATIPGALQQRWRESLGYSGGAHKGLSWICFKDTVQRPYHYCY